MCTASGTNAASWCTPSRLPSQPDHRGTVPHALEHAFRRGPVPVLSGASPRRLAAQHLPDRTAMPLDLATRLLVRPPHSQSQDDKQQGAPDSMGDAAEPAAQTLATAARPLCQTAR